MKRLMAVLLTLLLIATTLTATFAEELHGMTTHEIVARMGIGFNIGNTFDATGGNREDIYSQEQSWGNPIVDADFIKRIADAGFTCVRIPITWYRHTDADFTINPSFLARIKEVVDLCYEHDLYIIINMHHEEWLNKPELATEYEKIGVQFGAMWKQIAEYFAEYDQHLIFESVNEPRMAGTPIEWTGNKAGYEAVNYLNQVFVDTVLTDLAGNNGERALMIPGYAASSNRACLAAIELPTLNGEAVPNLVISVHSYTPYDFCLSDKQTAFDLNNRQHTGSIDTVFRDLQNLFLNKGIPVVMGETGATNTGNNQEARENWAYYFGQKAAAYGVPTLIWDNGNNQASGGECHAWVRRYVNPKLRSHKPYIFESGIKKLMEGAASIAWGTGMEKPEPVKSLMNGFVLWNSAEAKPAPIAVTSKEDWYPAGARYAVIFAGEGQPSITVSAADGETAVAPSAVQPFMPGKQLAWFDRADILGEREAASITKLTVTGDVTVYEFCIIGK